MAGVAKASSLGLRRIALLEGLGDACVERIAAACSWRRHEAGRQIVRRDAKDRDVHLLVDGRIRSTAYASSGRQVTFRDLEAGDLFGELAAIDGRMRSADVIALDDVLIATLPAQAFRDLLRDEPVVAERLIARLVGEVRRLSDHVIDLSTASVGQRLAAELLRLAIRAGVESGAARIAPMPTHAELAAQLGTYREQVTRELSALTRSGVVGKDGRAIVVPDVRRLQAIARRD
jgi:CRP/FNR family transcriptional regulator, cyclic AMP receptor protein